MPSFRYSAISARGQKLTGVLEAKDEFDAAKQIKSSVGGFIQSIKKAGVSLEINLTTPKVNQKALALCCSQFAALMRSGLPLARAVESVAEQATDKQLKKVFRAVGKDIRSGSGLADSMEEHGPFLPAVLLETVRAGELSGTLEQSFEDMEQYWRKSYQLKAKIKKALTYPAFLIAVAIAVILIIVIKVIPAFLPLFTDTGLPGPTQLLLNMYNFCKSKWGLLIVGVLALAVIALIQFKKTDRGKQKLSHLALKAPVIGRVSTMAAAAQFANTMASLLTAGVPMVNALIITAKVTSNVIISGIVGDAAKGVTEGKRLVDSLQDNAYFPSLLKEMISVGEESGSLESSLKTIGRYYEEETDAAVTTALGVLEPSITIFLGIIVGFILVALYLPMFNMGNGILNA